MPDQYLDSLGVFSSLKKLPDQIDQTIADMAEIKIPKSCSLVKNVVISGMGGSALGGRVISSIQRQTLKVPIVVSTEYHLPNFVDHQTLVVISSYSGNTEETLFSLAEARARDAQIYIVSTGGKLAELSGQYDIPAYIIDPVNNPSGQPRMGLGYSVMSIVLLLSRCGLINQPQNLGQLSQFLKNRQEQSVKASSLSEKLKGKIPVLIASEHLKGSAHCLKNQLNENSKTFSALFDIPELNHHLMEGLLFPKTNPDNLHFIFLESSLYQSEVKKRYRLTREVISKNHIQHDVIIPEGGSTFFEAMDVIQTGSYLAFYLSQVNGIDPGPIPWVDWYKDEIRKVV